MMFGEKTYGIIFVTFITVAARHWFQPSDADSLLKTLKPEKQQKRKFVMAK